MKRKMVLVFSSNHQQDDGRDGERPDEKNRSRSTDLLVTLLIQFSHKGVHFFGIEGIDG